MGEQGKAGDGLSGMSQTGGEAERKQSQDLLTPQEEVRFINRVRNQYKIEREIDREMDGWIEFLKA